MKQAFLSALIGVHRRPLTPRRTKSTRPARRIPKFTFFPLHRFIFRNDELRDAIGGMNRIILLPKVQQYDANLAAIPRVDSSRAIRQSNRMLQRQTAARPHLRFVTGRKRDRNSGRNRLWHVRFQDHRSRSAKIHPRVFQGTVRILRNCCFGSESFNSYSQLVMIAFHAQACPNRFAHAAREVRVCPGPL